MNTDEPHEPKLDNQSAPVETVQAGSLELRLAVVGVIIAGIAVIVGVAQAWVSAATLGEYRAANLMAATIEGCSAVYRETYSVEDALSSAIIAAMPERNGEVSDEQVAEMAAAVGEWRSWPSVIVAGPESLKLEVRVLQMAVLRSSIAVNRRLSHERLEEVSEFLGRYRERFEWSCKQALGFRDLGTQPALEPIPNVDFPLN